MQSGGGRFDAEIKRLFIGGEALCSSAANATAAAGLFRPSSLLRNGRVDLKAAVSGNGISTLPKGSRLY
jgi:hypothetical protein